jgi:hypothetical protein
VASIWKRIGQALGGALLLGACGCASFFEEVSSREFEFKALWSKKPEPLVVLRDSTDNARKAEALTRLREPLAHGGTQEQQELHMQILARAAVNEAPGQAEPLSRDPLCRLCAIRTLGEYRDPRALVVLEKAYQEAQPFTPEMNAMIRQQALASLELTGNPEARHILVRAARQPSASVVSSQTDRQYILDEKLAAVRALSKYPQSDSVETLIYLLETEKDVAVRHCAHNSLKTVTNRNLPEDPKAWRDLQTNGPEAAPAPGVIQRVTGLLPSADSKKTK